MRYLENFNEARPDSNCFIRFATEYLSVITAYSMQTAHGVLNFTAPYSGPRLTHNDHILFLGRMLEKNELEGTITRISPEAYRNFKELVVLHRTQQAQAQPELHREEEEVENF